jgi:hypothetical protein
MSAHDARVKHLCGQACLQKLVDRWMNAEMTVSAGHNSIEFRRASGNRG